MSSVTFDHVEEFVCSNVSYEERPDIEIVRNTTLIVHHSLQMTMVVCRLNSTVTAQLMYSVTFALLEARFFFISLGWAGNESTWYSCHYLAYCDSS
jgi:hypothetical protein